MKCTLSMLSTAAAVALLTGCGGGKDDSVPVAPAQTAKPAAQVQVNAKSATDAVSAPQSVAPPSNATATPPAATDGSAGSTDMFKGMTPAQIEEFKKNSTPETHDMNIGRVREAAEGFFKEFGHPATSQDQLVKARYLPSILPAPKGKKYVFDPKTTDVTVQNQ